MVFDKLLSQRSALRLLRTAIGAFALAAVGLAPALAQEIWFGPSGPGAGKVHAVDFMDLFTAEAPWPRAAAQVSVFVIHGPYLNGAPQVDIDRIVADLNRRHIAIALSVGVMDVGRRAMNPACGGEGLVEGYGTPQTNRMRAEKIKRAGGTVTYVAMDEPLWFGRYFNGRRGEQPGCHSSVADILGLIRESLGVYQTEFPGVLVGDIEPTGIAEKENWQLDLAAFASGFRQQTGRPLAFMQLDTPFNHPGEEGVAVTFYHGVEQLKRQGLIEKIGLIYDGTPDDLSDDAWVADAKAHVGLMEDKHRLRPDQALIESWMVHPQHVLPESAPGSLSGLVNYYAGRPK